MRLMRIVSRPGVGLLGGAAGLLVMDRQARDRPSKQATGAKAHGCVPHRQDDLAIAGTAPRVRDQRAGDPHIEPVQAKHLMQSIIKGDPERRQVIKESAKQLWPGPVGARR
jgi:predicted NBD/HSP70 family sugar kinase